VEILKGVLTLLWVGHLVKAISLLVKFSRLRVTSQGKKDRFFNQARFVPKERVGVFFLFH
jgi:hypothetical protein